MSSRNRIVGAVGALALGLAAASVSADVMVGGSAMYPQKNIVQNAVNSKDHTTLVAAVKAAGLVETLESKGPFTVFAPVNSAFDALPAGTVDSLLKPQNKATLGKVLTYHVVPGKYEASKVTQEKMLKTAQGGDLMIKEMNGKWMVGNDKGWATIIKTDVPASNGVIHWIDAVVMP